MNYFSSKSHETSHLSHKNSDKREKFSDKYFPTNGLPGGGALRHSPSIALASALLKLLFGAYGACGLKAEKVACCFGFKVVGIRQL